MICIEGLTYKVLLKWAFYTGTFPSQDRSSELKLGTQKIIVHSSYLATQKILPNQKRDMYPH